MTFQFLDVGMGDGTLVQMRSTNGAFDELMLVDFGELRSPYKIAYKEAMTYLVDTIGQNSHDRKASAPYVDMLVLTHPDGDHCNKLLQLVGQTYKGFEGKQLRFGKVVFGGEETDYGTIISGLWNSGLIDAKPEPLESKACAAKSHGGQWQPTWPFAGGAVKVYLLSANFPSRTGGDPNPKSVVLLFDCGGRKVTLQGDAEADVEHEILRKFDAGFLRAEAMKLGHHGSKGASSPAWIEAVRPSAIFASGDMVWAHPYCETVCRFLNRNILPENLPGFPDPAWYCCGSGAKENRQYYNSPTRRAVCLSMFYVVKSDVENLLEEKWDPSRWTPLVETAGWTAGVQWAFRVEDTGAKPSFAITPRTVPAGGQQVPPPFDCSSVNVEALAQGAALALERDPAAYASAGP
jgi:hypothetical protein